MTAIKYPVRTVRLYVRMGKHQREIPGGTEIHPVLAHNLIVDLLFRSFAGGLGVSKNAVERGCPGISTYSTTS
jgi:hypothetical protein